MLEKCEDKAVYELAGRWRASPYRGKFVEIKFGKDKNSPLFKHMKRPLVSRLVTPGAPDALVRPRATRPSNPRTVTAAALLADLSSPRASACALLTCASLGLSRARANTQDSEELGFLRDLPGPSKRLASRRQTKANSAGRNRMMLAGDAVVEYWSRDQSRSVVML